MKKATNSKNRGKISKLFPIMQEHFGQSMNLAHIKLMALLLEALFKAQTVSLVRLANAMPTAVDKESNMRQLQRFLACYVLDRDLIARMIFSLLPVSSGLVLTMDRTNWVSRGSCTNSICSKANTSIWLEASSRTRMASPSCRY